MVFAELLHNFDRQLTQSTSFSVLLRPGVETHSTGKMKKTIIATAWILTGFSLAQGDPNIFKKAANSPTTKADKKPEETNGPAFANLQEHISVPVELLDNWLKDHPLKEDATELRAMVQQWIIEGKARLEHTGYSLGMMGNEAKNDSIVELTYPADFMPMAPGLWPVPAAFETKNIGFGGSARLQKNENSVDMEIRVSDIRLVSSKYQHALVEKTQHPEDMLMPTFKRLTFSHQEDKRKADYMLSKAGSVQFIGRADDTLKSNSKERFSHLVFNTCHVKEKPASPSSQEFKPRMISLRVLRVKHETFSTWIHNKDLNTASIDAKSQLESNVPEASIIQLGEMSGLISSGKKTMIEDVEEYIYPTEWDPAEDSEVETIYTSNNGNDKKITKYQNKTSTASGLGNISVGTSFETRNVGLSFESATHNDNNEIVVSLSIEKVTKIGETVHRRIEVDGKWIPDITNPLFTSSRINTKIRIEPNQWTLVSSGTEFIAPGKHDPDHCLLFFVKVE